MASVQDLVQRLRAVKTCEDEPFECSDDSGPMCGKHDFSNMYTPLLREAALALEEVRDAINESEEPCPVCKSGMTQHHEHCMFYEP